MNDDILELFNCLLEEWREAEEVIINDRGNVDDYDKLANREKEYREKINELLGKL